MVADDVSQEGAQSLAELHRTHRAALVAFFMRRLGNHAEAEDLTQEVFTRMAQADAEAPQSLRSAEAYIFQVAANLLRDRIRRDKVRTDYLAGLRLSDDAGIDRIDPHRVAAGREHLAKLSAALADLPERTRQIFLLFRYENLDQRSIAESFGISSSAVEKHIYRAMARLMRRVGDIE